MNDTVLVTVNGEDFRTAVEKRIAELEVEVEEERRDTEERDRKREEKFRERMSWYNERSEDVQRTHDKWINLPWWKKVFTAKPLVPYVPHPMFVPLIHLYPKAQRLEQMKSYLPCPTGSMHINIELARELGLV